MNTIIIVDDDAEARRSISRLLNAYYQKHELQLKVIDIAPYRNQKEYMRFIEEKDVAAILLDERLNDKPIDKDGTVGYVGSELITVLRRRLPDIPIFSLTSYVKDEDLLKKEADFELLIPRGEFQKKSNVFAARIERSAQRYVSTRLTQFADLHDLSLKAANGTATPEEVMRLNAIQSSLGNVEIEINSKATGLMQLEEEIKKLEELLQQIETENHRDETQEG